MALLEDVLVAIEKRRPRKVPAGASNPFLEGNFAPVGTESDFPSLQVIAGALPPDLRGTLYRMSPAPKYDPLNRALYHWFDGDGMIDAFVFDGKTVSHKNRWVQTEKLQLEQRAGQALFGGLRDLASSTKLEGLFGLGFTAPEILALQLGSYVGKRPTNEQIGKILRSMDRSNTSIQLLAGKLLSLVEGSGGHEIDPQTLATRGRFDFSGVIDLQKGGMVAHPKVEHSTGKVFTFGYWGERGGISYYALDRAGQLILRRDIDLPYPAMMHDFSVTESRAVFYHMPAVLHMEDLSSPDTIRWEPEKGARIVVIGREDPQSPLHMYHLPPCYIFHPLNAFDDGDAVVLDVVKYRRLPLFDSVGDAKSDRPTEEVPGLLTRLRLCLLTGKITESVLDDVACEFPSCDPRYATRRHRYGFVAARRGETTGEGPFNAIGCVDFDSRTIRYRSLGPSSFTNEPLFVPRHSDAAEGEGYLLSTVFHAKENVCDVLVLDAQNVDGDPVAVVRAKQRVPFGFHGTWVSAS
ncbi:MAG TPA: carotenoid oxygenase family protein [Pseudomonadota bacterium]|nr:carotenoid oxygenase family protein [Pseudomonadota bacterium]